MMGEGLVELLPQLQAEGVLVDSGLLIILIWLIEMGTDERLGHQPT